MGNFWLYSLKNLVAVFITHLRISGVDGLPQNGNACYSLFMINNNKIPAHNQANPSLRPTMMDFLFNGKNKNTAVIISLLLIPLMLLLTSLFYSGISNSNSFDGYYKFDLKVISTKVDSGYRQESKLLIYTEAPKGVSCRNTVIQKSLIFYRDEASKPQPGDTLEVYISPDVECTANGLFLPAETIRTTAEIIYANAAMYVLIVFCLVTAIYLTMGIVYSISAGFRRFYSDHAIIGRALMAIFGVAFFATCLAYMYDWFSLSPVGFVLTMAALAILHFVTRKYRK